MTLSSRTSRTFKINLGIRDMKSHDLVLSNIFLFCNKKIKKKNRTSQTQVKQKHEWKEMKLNRKTNK